MRFQPPTTVTFGDGVPAPGQATSPSDDISHHTGKLTMETTRNVLSRTIEELIEERKQREKAEEENKRLHSELQALREAANQDFNLRQQSHSGTMCLYLAKQHLLLMILANTQED